MKYLESFFRSSRKWGKIKNEKFVDTLFKNLIDYLKNNEFEIYTEWNNKTLKKDLPSWINFLKLGNSDNLIASKGSYFLISRIKRDQYQHRPVKNFCLHSIVIDLNDQQRLVRIKTNYLSLIDNINDVNSISQLISREIVRLKKRSDQISIMRNLSNDISDDYIKDCLVDVVDLNGSITINRRNDGDVINPTIGISIHHKYRSDYTYASEIGNSLLLVSNFMQKLKLEFDVDSKITFNDYTISVVINLN